MITNKPITSIIIFLTILASTTYGDELAADFRLKEFDNESFRLIGDHAEQLITTTSKGLSVKVPSQPGKKSGAVGVAPRARIRGDFEISSSFEIVRVDKPKTGYGVGVGLILEFDSPQKDAITIERFLMPEEGEVFCSTKINVVDEKKNYFPKRSPATSKSGKFLVTRKGSSVSIKYADGDGDFRLLRKEEMGTDDVTYARLAADPLYSEYGVDAIFHDFRITADELIDPANPKSSKASALPIIVVSTITLLLLGFALWWWKLKRQPTSSPVSPSPKRSSSPKSTS